MRGTGAARRRQEREQEPPPDPLAASVAEIGRVIAGSDAVRQEMGRHERAIEAELVRMRQLAAECPNAERLAVAADNLAARVAPVVVELIAVAAQSYEARQALERCAEAIELRAASASFIEAQRAAAFEAGRQAGIAEEQARQSRAPRSRPAHRKGHLRPVPGISAAAVKAAVAASVVAASVGGTVMMHEESSVRAVASAPAAAGGVHQMAPDSAVEVPSFSPQAYVPRHAKPAADAASARPAPSSSPLPAFTPAPPSSPLPAASPVTFDGTLDVQTAQCVITSAGGCVITFSAVGGEVSWSAWASSPDLLLSAGSGTLAGGHPGTVGVTVRAGALAGSGTVTIADGHGNATQVAVTWVAVPGLAI